MPPSDPTPEPATGQDALLDAAFGHGYLVLPGGRGRAPAEVTGWPVRRIAGSDYHLHPRTVVSVASPAADGAGPGTVVLLGHPVDVAASSADGDIIAARLLDSWRTGGLDAAVVHAAYLGGRFTAFLHPAGPPSRLTVVPDCAASQPVLWSDRGGLALGSSGTLVAGALGLGPDPAALAAYEQLDAAPRKRRTVAYPPGLLTEYDGVRMLTPNHLLTIDVNPSPAVRQVRFWPARERREEQDVDRVLARFRERLTAHVGLLSSLGRTAISLTAGLDSRTTLAAMLPHRRPDSFAFTYYNPRQGVQDLGHRADLFDGNQWACLAGLPHLSLHWQEPDDGDLFTRVWQRMYPVVAPSVGAAHAMYAGLPRDVVQLGSNLGEVGTANPAPRLPGPLTPRTLSALWQSPWFADRHDYDAVFADYQEETALTGKRLLGHDPHDVFYWEHRMGKWGVRKYADADVSHRLLLPFNDRELLETMLSLPLAAREGKVLFHRMQEGTPELAGGPPGGTGGGADALGRPVGLRDVLAARPRWRRDVLPRARRAARAARGRARG